MHCRAQAVPPHLSAFRVGVISQKTCSAEDEALVFNHAQAISPDNNGPVHWPHLKLQMPLNRAPVVVVGLVVKRGCAGKIFVRHKTQ